ncbi:MAG: hypothetical protein EOP11_06955 [Proteobacteria bacterium]|nr:MAG: hypothetical protein EOP11_06955 [Pseudomonadota bacterium]
MKKLLLSLGLLLSPLTSTACSLPLDWQDHYRNDLILEVLRDYRVNGQIENIGHVSIAELEVTPFNTFRSKIPCFDSIKLKGRVSMTIKRKLSHSVQKRNELGRDLSDGKITEGEYEAKLQETEVCDVNAEVDALKAPKKAGDFAYRYDSKIGLEINCRANP